MNGKIKVDKLSAARRQLGAAIRMWFQDEDPVAIHTLALASTQVICDLLRHRGQPDFLRKNPRVRPERRAEYARTVKASANFFKHADEDPNDEQEFNPEVNDFQLLECLMGLQQLGVTLDDDEMALWIRVGIEHPQILVDGAYAEIDPETVREIRGWTRQQYYKTHKRIGGARGLVATTVG